VKANNSSEAQEKKQLKTAKKQNSIFFSYGKQSLEVSCFYSGPFFF